MFIVEHRHAFRHKLTIFDLISLYFGANIKHARQIRLEPVPIGTEMARTANFWYRFQALVGLFGFCCYNSRLIRAFFVSKYFGKIYSTVELNEKNIPTNKIYTMFQN